MSANVDFTPWLGTSSLSSTCAFATLTPAIGNAFGNQFVGTSSSPVTFTLHNLGTADLHVSTATLGSPNPGQFTISNDLCSGQTVAPAGTCTVDVAFAPTSVGAKTASLDIASDATNGTVSVPLSGTGTARVSISPASNGFGNQRVGTVSAPVDFTVTNLDTVRGQCQRHHLRAPEPRPVRPRQRGLHDRSHRGQRTPAPSRSPSHRTRWVPRAPW